MTMSTLSAAILAFVLPLLTLNRITRLHAHIDGAHAVDPIDWLQIDLPDMQHSPLTEIDFASFVQAINNNTDASWTAGVNERFVGSTVQQIKRLMGVKMQGSAFAGQPETHSLNKKMAKWKADQKQERVMLACDPLANTTLSMSGVSAETDLPLHFDGRQAWPHCPSISSVSDQSSCGSCWSVALVDAASDRICIATQGRQKPNLSARDLLSCCGSECGEGCEGGYIVNAWKHLVSTGIVTGGGFKKYGQGCVSYPFEECRHHPIGEVLPSEGPVTAHLQLSERPVCKTDNTTKTPECRAACDVQSDMSTRPLGGEVTEFTVVGDGDSVANLQKQYALDKYRFKSSYIVKSDADVIAREIVQHGSVEVALTVYTDFLLYKSGVYRHVQGIKLGGHAIRLIGFGVEESSHLPYWLAVNSWNEDWGDRGRFKILRGSNECNVEELVLAGIYSQPPKAK